MKLILLFLILTPFTAKIDKPLSVLPANQNKDLNSKEEIRKYVLAMSDIHGLDVDKVDRLVNCESTWDNKAVSPSGKYVGLYQISSIHNIGDCRTDVICSTRWFLDHQNYSAWPVCG